ncbi:MAG: alpha-L-fucosidase [Ferruginibacter sp.]|nr:alpha-L-fucosidase [Ferruginibacter sp.]
MKKTVLLCLSLATMGFSFAQTYQPNWQSLDQRPTPQWFRDAKFGIFIHWGVYAVPGWSTKGNYAEWYQQGLQTTDTARQRYHKAKFGSRSYYDLANDFKAELFNPDEWASLFEQSGAKYIVLTSKHHDGFTLWPSKEADKTWGFKWNAVDVGPERDLLGDLFKAVRKTPVRAGMYFSLYEWFNPLWKADKNRYAAEHAWPQMKDLINTYQPDVFWTDGDWEAPPETWKSQEFLTWLYNESPVKDKVVVNDRWGEGVRFKHAGVYTPEYQPELDFEDHYWEESRGMGYSYGYNREEDAWDYNSAQSLVLQLIDKVSRGGNFLLDIGPDEHGKIPPIMQERLLQMGAWLKINGEAIYGTSRWKIHSQWSEGNREYKDRSGDMLLKITVDPDPGYAVKEVFYTYNSSTNTLYAIFPRYPDDKKLLLKDVSLSAGTAVSFLSTKEELQWQQQGGNTVIGLPEYNPNKIRSPYAFVLKIGDYGKFSPKPAIKATYGKGATKPVISLSVAGAETIRYTTDGTEPGPKSPVYSKPFSIDKTSIIRAKAYQAGALPGATLEEKVKTYDWKNAAKTGNVKRGIVYNYYQPDKNINMISSFKTSLVSSGIADVITVAKKQRVDKFAFEFNGYIKVAGDAVYTFYTRSDDGSKLFIDDEEVVDNDGDHGTVEKSGKAALKKGFHKIRVIYFDSGGGNELKVLMQPEGGKKEELPAGILFH